MTTKISDLVGIFPLIEQEFSQSDPVLVRQLKKCSPIQSCSVQNWLQSWPSAIQSCPYLSLVHAHLCHLPMVRVQACSVQVWCFRGSAMIARVALRLSDGAFESLGVDG